MIWLRALSSPVFSIIITVSYWAWIGFEIWLVAREKGIHKNNSQDHGSRGSIIVWWVAAITLGIFAAPYLVPQLATRCNAVGFASGIVLIWAGILLRFWAVRTLGKFFRSKVVIQEEHSLVTKGPYRYLRNPSYTAVLMTLLGFGVGVGNWLSIAILCVGGFASFLRRITVEDHALSNRFGQEYLEYKKRTWALIPFVW